MLLDLLELWSVILETVDVFTKSKKKEHLEAEFEQILIQGLNEEKHGAIAT